MNRVTSFCAVPYGQGLPQTMPWSPLPRGLFEKWDLPIYWQLGFADLLEDGKVPIRHRAMVAIRTNVTEGEGLP
jgi:hypothetical protein